MSSEEDRMLKKMLVSANRVAPEDRQITNLLIDIYQTESKHYEAIQVGERFMRIVATDIDIIEKLAASYLKSGRIREYQHWLEDLAIVEETKTIEAVEQTDNLTYMSASFVIHPHIQFARWPLHDQLGFLERGSYVQLKGYFQDIHQLLQDEGITMEQRVALIEALHRLEDVSQYKLVVMGEEVTVIPAQIDLRVDNTFYNSLIERVTVELENENPSLAQEVETVIRRHQTATYPLTPDFGTVNEWCESYLEWFYRLNQEPLDNADVSKEVLEIDEVERYALENMSF
ncbi:hypothetical protein [Brochothrix thermosphacta]|uniref:Uncharacterized protein n=1 Tax=Brochothrix thermosphacta TaxID=2756 RepID=A0A1D2LTS1_BROTH|nr:hypothetical protein [Brochothrix thermosphacta]ATF25129.1 hypothetical protein CNY62_01320 [Brochothrix thermosphacta]ATH84512.1 hypothetical protein CPF12_01150 [Brochothrix thermosphacta]MPQ27513.1 hypothetical protein [Brochothrix thermosphacta]ODJ55785.1 hypothetical protein BFR38_07315 [Brochothrix thermosphacta]ODJ60813.1 hypothetical protein BFR42_02530 [Brochothrix thermosphacta]